MLSLKPAFDQLSTLTKARDTAFEEHARSTNLTKSMKIKSVDIPSNTTVVAM
jgi:hypothetical protein